DFGPSLLELPNPRRFLLGLPDQEELILRRLDMRFARRPLSLEPERLIWRGRLLESLGWGLEELEREEHALRIGLGPVLLQIRLLQRLQARVLEHLEAIAELSARAVREAHLLSKVIDERLDLFLDLRLLDVLGLLGQHLLKLCGLGVE